MEYSVPQYLALVLTQSTLEGWRRVREGREVERKTGEEERMSKG